MGPATTSDVDLIAFHHDPDAVLRLLSPASRRRVRVVDDDPVDISGCDWSSPGLERAVTFPIDGPRGAVEVAVAGLFVGRPGTVVAPSSAERAPVEWWVLDVLARHATSAVDLRDVRWSDRAGIWWTQPNGPVRLPLAVDDPTGSVHAARVLQIAEGLPPREPVATWLRGAAEAGRGIREWAELLAARYAETALRHLEDPHRVRGRLASA